MSTCAACSRPVPRDADVCPECGSTLGTRVVDATVVDPASARTRVAGRRSGSPLSDGAARFVPGTVVAGRYRVVGLLGRGGMGEVYRADDLKLGASVALKFLPLGLERDPDRLARFLDEVRTARQVSHANVCRVHDVDEFEGQHFLSMEYVDGEDLASLLRRIGRLPEERAVEVARQICAGLAAVHEAGVLHRDLKPANVMIDGRGRVRLTDFGLASLDGSHDGLDARAGTPAYMAPELHQGASVTVQSDLYALGLVLYELFTGRPVFEAKTIDELSSLHASAMPSSPSQYVQSLDPAIERAVMRCLEKSPRHRPPSALAVSAALPGGDPLAAALAAGETPSPELVAASGTREALAPLPAIGLAVLAVLVFAAGAMWAGHASWIAYLPIEKRPEVLQDRAIDLIAQLGYTEEVYSDPVDHAWGWLVWFDVMREVAASDSSRTWYEGIRRRPDSGGYWYRQSPAMLMPSPVDMGPVFVRGAVDLMNPPSTTPGEISIVMDLSGRLRRFEAQPRRFAVEEPSEPDWSTLFAAAGLDTALFRSTTPRYQRFLGPDLRRAWVGEDPSRPGTEIRVEAGAFEGRVVLFNVASSTSLEELAAPPAAQRMSAGGILIRVLPVVLIYAVVMFVALFGSWNLRSRSADTRGAFRLAVFTALAYLITQGAGAHALFSWRWAGELWPLTASATFVGLVVWGAYLAAEPMGRRVWPSMFVSSSRLLSRQNVHWRDPLLGRSVLSGLLLGALCFLLMVPAWRWVAQFIVSEPMWPLSFDAKVLMGGRFALARIELPIVIGMVFLYVSALVVLQRWVRRRWLAAVLGVFVWTVLGNFYGSPMEFVGGVLRFAVFMVVLLRWGTIALVVAVTTFSMAWMARAVDYTHWTAGGATIALVLVTLLAVYGAWAATGTDRSAR